MPRKLLTGTDWDELDQRAVGDTMDIIQKLHCYRESRIMSQPFISSACSLVLQFILLYIRFEKGTVSWKKAKDTTLADGYLLSIRLLGYIFRQLVVLLFLSRQVSAE